MSTSKNTILSKGGFVVNSFRENLIKLRKSNYPSAKKFADDLGLPYNTYISYENAQKPAEPKYDTLIKIASLLGVSTDELLGYTPVKNDFEKCIKFITETTNFKVDEVEVEGKGVMYDVNLNYSQKNNHDKLFVNDLMRQSNDLATMEKKVLEHNVKVYFGGLFENYMQADLLHPRPHGADLTIEDQSKIIGALRKNYPNIDEDIMNRTKSDWEERATRKKVLGRNFLQL